MKRYALVTAQGTACAETVLTEAEYLNPATRAREEKRAKDWRGAPQDAPIPGSWFDVSDNEACS